MVATSEALDFSRIEHLLNPEALSSIHVTMVGLGSGGAPVCDHLCMARVRRWSFFDHDDLQPVNLVKHPRMRADIGRPKVEVQREWILDRNPAAEVSIRKENVLSSESFSEALSSTDWVLSCPDTRGVREFVSDKCVEAHVPFVVGSVFRTGFGGEVYAYVPGETGCFSCLEMFAEANGLNMGDADIATTEEEQQQIYGLGNLGFQASGLSMDIQMIALIQARMALSILAKRHQFRAPTMKANWIIFANRPFQDVFKHHFEARQMRLRPQASCPSCGGKS